MAKTWIMVKHDVLLRKSHITDVYIDTGKTEETRHEDKFYYFVKATARNETYTIAGPFNTKAEAMKWMKENFK